MTTDAYLDFLKQKVSFDRSYGFTVAAADLSPILKLIERFSNPGDLVYDPFAGIGTVPRQALLAGRRGRGVELNPGYFMDGVRYCQAAESRVQTPTLFDLIEVADA